MLKPTLNETEKHDLVEDLRAFLRHDSRSTPLGGTEGPLQRLIAQKMRDAGARVRVVGVDEVPGFREHPLCHGPDRDYSDRPTVIAEVGTQDPDAPALLVFAHSDTVEVFEPEAWTVDPFGGILRDGAIYGLGVSDDKWGLAAMLLCLRRAANRPLRKRLIFVSTIDEENGVGNGPLLLHLAGLKADAALYLDGYDMNVMIGTCGGSTVWLEPISPVPADELNADLSRLTKACETFSLSRIPRFDATPGYQDNMMRDRSALAGRRTSAARDFLVIYFYTLPGEDRAAVEASLNQVIDGALGDRALRYRRSFGEPWFEPALSPADTPLIRHVVGAVGSVTGREPKPNTVSKQDNFILINHMGIPTVSFGPTPRGLVRGGFHGPDEMLTLDELFAGATVAAEAVERWLEA